MKKGQSAMEYLMTYGWAILVIIIVIAVLFYIGVLNPKNVTPTSCTFPPGMTCSSFKLIESSGDLELRIGQATGHPIMITNMTCTQESGTPLVGSFQDVGITVPIGEQRWISSEDALKSNVTVACLDSTGTGLIASAAQMGEFYKGKIWIGYVETDTTMTRTVVGDIAAKFEQA